MSVRGPWNAARHRSLRLAASGPLDDFLPLHLSNKGSSRKDEAAGCRVFEPLGHEFEFDPMVLELVEQNADVILIPRKPIDCVSQDDVNPNLAHQLAESRDT